MATTVWALDALSGAPNYTGIMLRNATVAPFAGVAPVGTPLGVRSGVRPGTPSSTAFLSGGSNFTWNVAAHAGIIQAETSATAGPYAYWTDGADTGTVTAANATYPRIDILYTKINDTVQDSSGLESGQVGYLAGTAAASPSPPATPARSMVLATISVPAVGGGNPSISWSASEFTDPMLAKAYVSASQSLAAGAWTVIGLDGIAFNNDGMYAAGAPNRLTCSTPGTYEVSGQLALNSSSSGTTRGALISINGAGSSSPVVITESPSNASVGAFLSLTPTIVHLNAGDYIQLYGFQNGSGSLAITTGVGYSFLMAKRVAGL